ncbi:MAG: tetratricopeptide repeat protein [Bacteroidales bacterium]
MNENNIESLREALKHSPENVPLRHMLAEALLGLNRLEEAEEEYSKLLKNGWRHQDKSRAGNRVLQKGSYSACNVILEEVIEKGVATYRFLYCMRGGF